MRVTFYGVRGGYPASGPGCVKVGSHTTCVFVEAGGHRIIVDAGTGIAPLGRRLLAQRKQEGRAISVVLLLTHGHHDHLAGLPHFVPFYDPTTEVHAFGPASVGTEEAVRRMFRSPWFPVCFSELPSRWTFRDVRDSEIILLDEPGSPPRLNHRAEANGAPEPGQVVVRILRCLGHPRHGVLVYRVEHDERAVVIATDVEGMPGGDVRLRRFAKGADLLVHDAQYSQKTYLGVPKQGFGHSTPEMAAEMASGAGVGRLLLTHHAPESDDEQVDELVAEARGIFEATDAAREGLAIEL